MEKKLAPTKKRTEIPTNQGHAPWEDFFFLSPNPDLDRLKNALKVQVKNLFNSYLALSTMSIFDQPLQKPNQRTSFRPR